MRSPTPHSLRLARTHLAQGIGRGRRKVAREGPRATLRHAVHLVTRRIYLREAHVWYRLETDASNRVVEMPAGVELHRGSHSDVVRVAEVGQDLGDAQAHFAAGHDLWLTCEDAAVLFACWTFRGTAPVRAAPGGTLDLAPGTACLENSFTAEHARGRGIAPASWIHIAGLLRAEGVKTLITKVETANAPSRRAVEKAGFLPFAVMHLTELAGHGRTSLEPAGEGPAADLAGRLRAAADEPDYDGG